MNQEKETVVVARKSHFMTSRKTNLKMDRNIQIASKLEASKLFMTKFFKKNANL